MKSDILKALITEDELHRKVAELGKKNQRGLSG